MRVAKFASHPPIQFIYAGDLPDSPAERSIPQIAKSSQNTLFLTKSAKSFNWLRSRSSCPIDAQSPLQRMNIAWWEEATRRLRLNRFWWYHSYTITQFIAQQFPATAIVARTLTYIQLQIVNDGAVWTSMDSALIRSNQYQRHGMRWRRGPRWRAPTEVHSQLGKPRLCAADSDQRRSHGFADSCTRAPISLSENPDDPGAWN